MIIGEEELVGISLLCADVVIVGCGPAGIVLALDLADRGVDVLIIESGGLDYSAEAQALSDAATWDRSLHAPMSIAVRRQIGGTSVIWGGRCVPYDPIDFEPRPLTGYAEWPVTAEELDPYFDRACEWFRAGRAVFDAEEVAHLPNSIVPGLENGDVRSSALERWSLPTNFGDTYRGRLRASQRVRVITGMTATEIVTCPNGGAVEHIRCRSLARHDLAVSGRSYVIAAGGLESTRLLLASKVANGEALGDHSGHLGRWYMGHVEGVVANVRFDTDPKKTIFGYERDVDGVYVRRRLTFSREFATRNDLPNIAAWLANPELADPAHDSGILSFVYLALSSPLGRYFAPDAQRLSLTGEDVPGSPYGGAQKGALSEHLRNLVGHPLETATFAGSFGVKRFLAGKRRAPGFFVYNDENLYPLQYHSEHLPNATSRVSLSDECDILGVRRLDVDMCFSDKDIDGVVRAHEHWDRYLREQGCGALEYLSDDIEEAIARRAGGGFHQIGTTRMSSSADDGVIDGNLAVHGFPNLHVASSSAFVTSGQANSTFLVVVLALRLADHLAGKLRE